MPTVRRKVKTIRIRIPDDWHCHLRELLLLYFVLRHSLEGGFWGRMLVMPNTKKPILDYKDAEGYERQVDDYLKRLPFEVPKTLKFVMTIQITPKTTPEMVYAAYRAGVRVAKVYPRDVTTNSKNGIRWYKRIYPALRAAEECGMYVCFHGEHPSLSVPGNKKSFEFLEKILAPILIEFPNLKVTLEHISTAHAVDFVRYWYKQRGNILATITAHHLYLTQGDVSGYTRRSDFKGHSECVCKPMIEWDDDREAIQEAATSGEPCFAYGGDNAVHTDEAKYCVGCACGVFNASVALAVVVSVFEKRRALRRLNFFLSEAGARHYGFPIINKFLTMEKRKWKVPKRYDVDGSKNFVVPMCAGWWLSWKLKTQLKKKTA